MRVRIELAAGLLLAGAAGGFFAGERWVPAGGAAGGPSVARAGPARGLAGGGGMRAASPERRRVEDPGAADRPDLGRALRGSADGASSEPARGAGEPASIAARVTPAASTETAAAAGEGRRRAEEIKAEADEALRQKDGKRALALLKELAAIGEDADPTAIDLLSRLSRSVRDGDKMGVTSYDLQKLMSSADMVPLEKRALLDPSADPRFRARAIDGMAMSDNPDTTPFLLSLVDQEHDGRVLNQMLGYLDEQSDPQVAATLARSLSGRTDPQERQAIIETLGGATGPDAQQALEQAAANDPDPSVRQAAKVELLARNPPVTGYMLTDIIPQSQAGQAGLQPGDVMLDYNGTPLGPDSNLSAERDKVAKGAPVNATIWRDGQTLQVQLRGGQIGVNGRGIAPR